MGRRGLPLLASLVGALAFSVAGCSATALLPGAEGDAGAKSPAASAPERDADGNVEPDAGEIADDALDAICGAGNGGRIGKQVGCFICPAFTGADGLSGLNGPTPELVTWVTYRVAGSFTRANASQVAVTMVGCELPSSGGTLLMELDPSGWRLVEYDALFAPFDCQTHDAEDGRTILLCHSSSFGMGIVVDDLRVRDFAQPWSPSVSPLFDVESDEDWICAFEQATDLGPFVIAQMPNYEWVDSGHVSATLDYEVFPGPAGTLLPHCADLKGFVEPGENSARLDFTSLGDQWSASPATAAVILASRGPNSPE